MAVDQHSEAYTDAGSGSEPAPAADIDEAPPRSPLRRAWNYFFVYLIWEQAMKTEHPGWERFFARRCPHLAGMIAYFGVLSVIPATFLFVSVLGLAGGLENQGWIVEQLKNVMPAQAANSIVRTVENLRANSGSLGVIGLFGLIWGTTNFFSCIESGLNIIYGVNNRHFIFQKGWVLLLMAAALLAMLVATLLVALVLPVLDNINEAADHVYHLPVAGGLQSVIISVSMAFLFFLSCYRFLPNTHISTREVWRGALGAAVAFEISILLLPEIVGAQKGGVVISSFAGVFIVLIWLYVMGFVLLAGGCYNWWHREKRRRAAATDVIIPVASPS
ncbi:MAG: ribonuclease [Thermoleophilia bacterium]|nr:ribonuclease [Thermoleophilia bacterium]